jgi:hypothetical protein
MFLLEKNTMSKKIKTLKEYLGLPTISIGGLDSYHPTASLGDLPPRGRGSKDSRVTGLQANYTSQAAGTMRPFLTASAKKLQQKNWKEKGHGPYRKEDTNRIPRKPGQKAGSDKHSDLYTDENPKGTIHGLGFTDAETARTSVNKIKSSGKTHAHKIQAAIAMSQRAKVASERAKDPKKKKDLGAAHKIYQSFIDTNKKKD